MLVVLPYPLREQARARKLLGWIAELGQAKDHSCLLVVDEDVDAREEERLARQAFSSVEVYKIDKPDSTKFPIPHNHTWKRAVDYIDHKKLGPFIYLECDAVPLPHPDGWLNVLEEEYEAHSKPFMGYQERAGQEGQHMNGVGIYRDIYQQAPMLMMGPTFDNGHNYMAFDMAGGNEVVPKMHVSPLFQFQYQKEVELLKDESLSWLNPDAVIFHTEKTGKLIDLLRARNGSRPGELDSSRAHIPTPAGSIPAPATNPQITIDIFIKTYPADAMWHEKCLASIKRYCTGFRDTVTRSGEHERGYNYQQVEKLRADAYSDAHYFLVTDSDTLFIRPVTPADFFQDGHAFCSTAKPIWFYASRESVIAQDSGTAKWFDVMERAIGVRPEHEFMRRQPFLAPRWLLQAFRTFILQRHGKTVEDYIMSQQEFTEWNVLGFYAWTFHREAFEWVDTSAPGCPPLTVRQFWSAHHFTPERRQQQFEDALPEINQILGIEELKTKPALPPPPVAPSDGWSSLGQAPKANVSGLAEKVIAADAAKAAAEEQKKEAARQRMAHARAQRGKKKPATAKR